MMIHGMLIQTSKTKRHAQSRGLVGQEPVVNVEYYVRDNVTEILFTV